MKRKKSKRPGIATAVLYWILSVSISSGTLFAADKPASSPGLTNIDVTCIDDDATGYATFNSHNQKVVQNENGIFMTHIRTFP